VKCSEERQVFQCGKKCERILNCCKHKCERNCHHGACLPCKKKHMVKCWCGKNEDVVDCVQAAYSCEEICGKKLNCGFHTCQDLCHEGNCKDCQKTPELQKTCPCGAYTIEMLTGDEFFRQKCEDPIPTCGMPCKKLLSCGHKCSKSCHEGNCS
jgi:transcriptional repressor NF-X1